MCVIVSGGLIVESVDEPVVEVGAVGLVLGGGIIPLALEHRRCSRVAAKRVQVSQIDS